MGGMAAQIPIKSDPERNDAALGKVRADKQREVGDGHDGTWVAHPGLVAVARAEFDAAMPEPHQIDREREHLEITADDLLTVPRGPITEAGLRHNLSVGVLYLASWLRGSGCVPIHHLTPLESCMFYDLAFLGMFTIKKALRDDELRAAREATQ